MVSCFIGIGSNLGQREEFIKSAVKKIKELKATKVIKVSKIIETNPVGGPAQRKFLNAAVKISTGLKPSELLKKLKRIERELGRTRTIRYGPRTIDLDILIYADKIINHRNLKVPHPKMFGREFVLKSLSEII